MPAKIKSFAESALVDPITVNVGRAGATNLDIIQEVGEGGLRLCVWWRCCVWGVGGGRAALGGPAASGRCPARPCTPPLRPPPRPRWST